MPSTVQHSATNVFCCADVVPIDDLQLLVVLENRIDLLDACAALAQPNKGGAQSLDAILKELRY